MPLGLRLLERLGLAVLIALAGASPSLAAGQPSFPAWLQAHVGEGEGQIAPVVLERARALYQRKGVRNPCYFAMDATRPHDLGGGLGRRFYIICEAQGSFRAISAGHGGGRDLAGAADFANGRRCVKNFGNAMDSDLTAGGTYVTGETTASFKGYYRASGGGDALFMRAFLKFDGEGETANARERAIGGHPAVLLRGVCRRKDPTSPHADPDGYVPFGKLVNYEAGRSDGCTSWSASNAAAIMAMVNGDPTTLYIYPESRDIDAVVRAVQAGEAPSRAGLYWNAACLKDIGAPRFWRKETLEPILARWREAHPAPPPQPPPICREP
ncbi:MAG TPA: hypothetical protein VGG77_06720 [Roseiarcus sp.]